jgi:hypothetical protein
LTCFIIAIIYQASYANASRSRGCSIDTVTFEKSAAASSRVIFALDSKAYVWIGSGDVNTDGKFSADRNIDAIATRSATRVIVSQI